MWNRATWKALLDRPWVEIMLFVVGVLLIIASPIAGVIPGPGGIFVFAAGLALVLKTGPTGGFAGAAPSAVPSVEKPAQSSRARAQAIDFDARCE
jgi:hypothetical protein